MSVAVEIHFRQSALSAKPNVTVPVQVKQQGGGTAVLERPQVITRSTGGSRDVPDGPGAAGMLDRELRQLWLRRRHGHAAIAHRVPGTDSTAGIFMI